MDIDLKKGDVITAVNGDPIFAFEQFKQHVEGSDGKVLLLNVWRDGADLEFALAPRRTDEPQPEGGFVTHWRIGIVGGMMIGTCNEAAGVWDSLSWRFAPDRADRRRIVVRYVAHDHRCNQHL